MKKLLALTLCLVLALGICSAFAEDQLTLRVAWWGGQERHNATIAALDEYAKANGITINYEYTSWGSYFENLATQSVGNNLPDVIQMSTTDIINYAENGKLIDLTPYVEDGIIDLTYIEESSLSGGKVGDMLAGFTTGTNTVSVVYNQELFDAAGVDYPTADWTWSEFIDDAKTIYEATGAQTEIPFIEEARWVVEAMVRSFGYDFFSADGESLPWAEDEAVVNAVVAAIQDVQDGIKAGYFVDPEVQIAWITTEDTYIAQGKSAMSFRLSNYYPMYCNVIGRELGVAMLPRLDDGSQSGM
ncbi:MAG: extracellular solute-binding protein, partial [Clostridia bacterium]|nr:extracellular solute-binding protein [Clostridia bacterium]